MKEIEKMALDFVWRKKRHQVNKKVICYTFKKGGLDMFDFSKFDQSLKISWIYKGINSNLEWLHFAKIEKN